MINTIRPLTQQQATLTHGGHTVRVQLAYEPITDRGLKWAVSTKSYIRGHFTGSRVLWRDEDLTACRAAFSTEIARLERKGWTRKTN